MAYGVKKLRFIQLGKESSAAKGTEVDATVIWRGMGSISDNRVKVMPDEDVGYLPGTTRQYEPYVEAGLSMDEVEATFEQLPIIFEASIERESATAEGGGYLYEYNAATTTPPNIATYTVEGGDNADEEQFTYGFVESWSLSGKVKESLMISAEWIGREVAPGTKTSPLSLIPVEEILFQRGKLYIDGTTSTHGGTQVTGSWLDFTLDYTSGLKAVPTGDGNKYFSFEKMTMPEAQLQITLEHATLAVAEKAAWRAGTTRLVRMEFTGSALSTTGANYDSKTLRIDLTGKWDSFGPLDDDDGDDTVQGTMTARYDIVADHYMVATVVNTLASL